jgi:hypothetical protein
MLMILVRKKLFKFSSLAERLALSFQLPIA